MKKDTAEVAVIVDGDVQATRTYPKPQSFRHYCTRQSFSVSSKLLSFSLQRGINLQTSTHGKTFLSPQAKLRKLFSICPWNSELCFGFHLICCSQVQSLSDSTMSKDDCFTTQLIDKNGELNVAGLEDFTRKIKLAECGLSYAVVAVMGPQSSGMLWRLHLHLLLSFCLASMCTRVYACTSSSHIVVVYNSAIWCSVWFP